MKEKAPNYVIILILIWEQIVRIKIIAIYQATTIEKNFKVIYFPSTLKDWFNLDNSIRSFESVLIYRSRWLFKAMHTIYLTQKNKDFCVVCVQVYFISMSICFVITFKIAWIHYVFIVCRLKIHNLLHCYYVFKHRIGLWIV